MTAVITFLSMKNEDERQAGYDPEIDSSQLAPGNRGRRKETWAIRCASEASAFINALYADEASPWHHGFHQEHAKKLFNFVTAKRYHGNKRVYEVWNVEEGQYPNLDLDGVSTDMEIDFRMAGYKCCGPILPCKGRFEPIDPANNQPPLFVSTNQVEEGGKKEDDDIQPLLDMGRNMMAAMAGETVAANTRPAPVDNLIPFVFVCGDRRCEVATGLRDVTWKSFVTEAWQSTMDYKVFPHTPAEIEKIQDGSVELYFKMTNMGNLSMRYLKERPVSMIVDAVPVTKRPIIVQVSCVATLNEVSDKAVSTALVASLF